MKVIVNGACGRMGHALAEQIQSAPGCEIAALVDPRGDGAQVLTRLEEILRNAELFNCEEDNGEKFYNLAHYLSFDRGGWHSGSGFYRSLDCQGDGRRQPNVDGRIQ